MVKQPFTDPLQLLKMLSYEYEICLFGVFVFYFKLNSSNIVKGIGGSKNKWVLYERVFHYEVSAFYRIKKLSVSRN